LHDPVHDGAEQRRLVGEAVIERALGNSGALRDCLDAGGAVAFGEEQISCSIEDAISEQSCLLARGAAAAPWG
jgi:hypothetical protein